MKNSRIFAFATTLLALASCSPESIVDIRIEGAPEGREIVVKTPYRTLDTLRTDKDGAARLGIAVPEGQPEFVHFWWNGTNIASVILANGDQLKVSADTLGFYTATGSEETELLSEVNASFAKFTNEILGTEVLSERVKLYLDHYRSCLKFTIEHPKSLVCIPVLYEKVGGTPVFNNYSDAIYFRSAADSLKTVYPESAYVLALEKEAKARMNQFEVANRIKETKPTSFPRIEMPDINGKKVALDSLGSKVTLLHFWDASDVAQKMMNIENLQPLYDRYRDKGFQIYSVCVSPDKAQWANVVKSQKLEWINVNDGKGGASEAITLYNVRSLPCSFVIADGNLEPGRFNGVDNLEQTLKAILR